MAIILYFGVPGSGKSYEVVNSRVIPALKEGRRVVTNIRGLDIKLIQNYIKKNDKKYDIKKLGELISVDHDLIQTPDFFPYFDEEEKPVENTY
ncbi:zonular occludens toxin domain-containing protein, partial [Klebsiella pneumoniae]